MNTPTTRDLLRCAKQVKEHEEYMTPLIYAMHLEYLFILADSNYLQRFTQQHEV